MISVVVTEVPTNPRVTTDVPMSSSVVTAVPMMSASSRIDGDADEDALTLGLTLADAEIDAETLGLIELDGLRLALGLMLAEALIGITAPPPFPHPPATDRTGPA